MKKQKTWKVGHFAVFNLHSPIENVRITELVCHEPQIALYGIQK